MSPQLRYHPCREQRALAETFNASFKTLLPLERLHASPEEAGETWRKLDDIGLFSIAAAEEAGGSGLGAAEEALIVMELGRCMASPSVIATIGTCHVQVTDRDASDDRPRTALAYRHGARIVVVADGSAEQVLLRDGTGAALYRSLPEAGAIEDRLWHVHLREGAAGGIPMAGFDAAGLLRLRLNDAAALAGIATAALDMAVAYAGQRRQFGRPIGSFQAVKHHCADMAIAARNAGDQVTFAAVSIDEGRDDAALQVDCALFVAGMAALGNAAINIQVHGGIGFSEEAMPHLLVKRARLLATAAGGLEAANERIAGTGGRRSTTGTAIA